MKVDVCYAELIAALKQHIAEAYPFSSWLECEEGNYAYFKNCALQAKTGKKIPTDSASISSPVAQKFHEMPATTDSKPVQVAAVPVAKNFTEPKAPPLIDPEPEPLISQDSVTTAKVIGTSQKPETKPQEVGFKRTLPTLEKPPKAEQEGVGDLQKLWQEKFPHLPFIETIPPDDSAREIALQWQVLSHIPEVVVLAFGETAREKSFLKNLSLAVQYNIAPACIIPAAVLEGNDGWQTLLQAPRLKLLIANHSSLSALPAFVNHFREEPSSGRNYLGKIPLHLLADLSLYIAEPRLKVTLWRTLCQLLRR